MINKQYQVLLVLAFTLHGFALTVREVKVTADHCNSLFIMIANSDNVIILPVNTGTAQSQLTKGNTGWTTAHGS